MKINQTSSRKVLILTTAFLISLSVRAEIFLGSSNSVNSLVVASNEVILISAARIEFNSDNMGSFSGQINLNGTMQPLGIYDTGEKPLALAGPATLNFPADSGTNSLPVCICFQRITGSSIQSLYVPVGGSTNSFPSIQIPAGKTCHFFCPVGYSYSGFVNVQTGSNTVNNIQILGGEEFSGPANLTFSGALFSGAVVSFYQTDDALNLPNGVLQGSTGSFVITVEKSADLKNWSPTMIQSTGESRAAFYRLNFSH